MSLPRRFAFSSCQGLKREMKLEGRTHTRQLLPEVLVILVPVTVLSNECARFGVTDVIELVPVLLEANATEIAEGADNRGHIL